MLPTKTSRQEAKGWTYCFWFLADNFLFGKNAAFFIFVVCTVNHFTAHSVDTVAEHFTFHAATKAFGERWAVQTLDHAAAGLDKS